MVSMGAKEVRSSLDYVFTLNTPGRDFILTANTREDMDQWICAFQKVQNTDPTSQDLRRKISNSLKVVLSVMYSLYCLIFLS
jgi:uncharacterized protein involved in tellurium resistance